MKHRSFSPRIASLMLAMVVGASTFSAPAPALAAAAPLPIVQVPLTSPSPIRPQVLFAVGNSESMDGTLSGAIMTGSGAQSGNESAPASLLASSSPADFAVPAGFTPPLAAGSGGQAPITVVKNGVEYDNSASRLNVAKGSVRQILSSYLASTDFALEDYATSNVSVYQTWVYYMSNPGGFVFTNTPSSGGDYVANPCYGYGNFAGVSDVQNDCYQIDQSGLYGGGYGSRPALPAPRICRSRRARMIRTSTTCCTPTTTTARSPRSTLGMAPFPAMSSMAATTVMPARSTRRPRRPTRSSISVNTIPDRRWSVIRIRSPGASVRRPVRPTPDSFRSRRRSCTAIAGSDTAPRNPRAAAACWCR
jgi:type IV pilus assembly protein PilY1